MEKPGRGRVVHCQREPYDLYIGRSVPRKKLLPSVWGNPYQIGRDGTREQVIAKYRAYVLSRPDLLARVGELRGKVLGCWCAPLGGLSANHQGVTCHGEILLALAEEEQRMGETA